MGTYVHPRAMSLRLGSVAPGSKLNFYIAGTSTRKDTFDEDGNANANPVVADANGIFPYIAGVGDYKVVLTDSSDSILFTQDDYNWSSGESLREGFDYLVGATDSAVSAITNGYAPAIGDVVSVTYYDSNQTIDSGADWKCLSITATSPDTANGINSDGYFYALISGSDYAKFEVVGDVNLLSFGLSGSGDETSIFTAGLAAQSAKGGGEVYCPISASFTNIVIPFKVFLVGRNPKDTILTSTATSGDAITIDDDPTNQGNFWNGIKNFTSTADAARQAGSGRGIVADCGDTSKVVFKLTIDNVISEYHPGIGCEIVQPEEARISMVCQYNGGKGFVVSSPSSIGISNDIDVRCMDNVGRPVDIKTYASGITFEALVRGDSPVYTGVLAVIDGDGNNINNPDIELNSNPSDANILLCTGLQQKGDNNTIHGGFYGNCGIGVEVRGRGNKLVKPDITIYSTAATSPVVGSIAVQVASGAVAAHVEYEPSGMSKIETILDDLAADTVVIASGQVNGLYRVLTASSTWDPASTAAGGTQTTSISVTGAVLGDPVSVGHTGLTAGIGGNNKVQLTGFAINGTVYVQMTNQTGSTLDVPSGTLKVCVFQT